MSLTVPLRDVLYAEVSFYVENSFGKQKTFPSKHIHGRSDIDDYASQNMNPGGEDSVLTMS